MGSQNSISAELQDNYPLVFVNITKKYTRKWGIERQFHETLSIQHIQQGLRNIKDVMITGKQNKFTKYFQFHINFSNEFLDYPKSTYINFHL